jgi:hypothetical protein
MAGNRLKTSSQRFFGFGDSLSFVPKKQCVWVRTAQAATYQPTAFTSFTRLQYTIHSWKVKVGSPSKTKTKPANASIVILSSLHWLHCVPAETQIKDATTNEIDTHRRIELIGIEQ